MDTEKRRDNFPHVDPEYLTRGWVDHVAKTPEADLRAHRIALTYSKFAIDLDNRAYGARSFWRNLTTERFYPPANANWFHFATWATLTVSRNIGNVRAPQRLSTLPFGLRRALGPITINERASDRQRVGRALSWAQRLVFINTCLAYLQMKEQSEGAHRSSSAQPGAAYEQMAEDLTNGVLDAQSRQVTREAFGHYFSAGRLGDGDREAALRDQMVFAANVTITAVEQHVVNGGIRAVVESVPQRVFTTVERRIADWSERLGGVSSGLSAFSLPNKLQTSRDVASHSWARFLTDQVFVLSLPGETLRVGRDIPPLDAAAPYYPKALRYLDEAEDEIKNEILTLSARFDRTTRDGRGSAARDWRNYDERMNWAFTLLRSRQCDASLFWQPYSHADETRILNGELPTRLGDPAEFEVLPPLDRDLAANGGGEGGNS